MHRYELPIKSLAEQDQQRVRQAMGTSRIYWENNLAADPLGALREAGFTGKPFVVGDPDTYAAFGADWGETPKLELIRKPFPTLKTAEHIRREFRDADYLVALGSGTINDLCKYVAHLKGKPYVVIPTAPSMNGYLSANASLTVDGHKKSLAATMPEAVFCSIKLLASAPQRMIAAGFSDAMCRFTAQTDMLLAHLLRDQPYDTLPFKLTEGKERVLCRLAPALQRSDMEAVALLTEHLLLSGLGMVIAGSSAPASQGEHMIAHVMGMSPPTAAGKGMPLHGEEIAVTTLTMAGIQEAWLHRSPSSWFEGDWKDRVRTRQWKAPNRSKGFFGRATADEYIEGYQRKMPRDHEFEQFMEEFYVKWDAMRQRILAEVPRYSPSQFLEMLQTVGAPTDASRLGYVKAQYAIGVKHAHFMRDRFGFLDIEYLFGKDS